MSFEHQDIPHQPHCRNWRALAILGSSKLYTWNDSSDDVHHKLDNCNGDSNSNRPNYHKAAYQRRLTSITNRKTRFTYPTLIYWNVMEKVKWSLQNGCLHTCKKNYRLNKILTSITHHLLLFNIISMASRVNKLCKA